jgi:hypothetical protein
MKYLFLVLCVATLGSCSTIYPLADRELDYKLDKLWLEYKYEADSLIYHHYAEEESKD